MDKKIAKIREILNKTYPDADCTLDYAKPYELLIATQLAAQCTDARVNLVMRDLVKTYATVEDFANADVNALMDEIRPTGFFRNKAKNIIAACKMLLSDFNGIVPDNMDDLLKLPGVGRKTANLILGDVFGKPAVVVDTHAGRLARRMGLTKNTDPYKVERDLQKLLPPDYQSLFCHQLVLHGRKYCKARKPDCSGCPLTEVCDKILR
ncbi:MAG: endonuclease III [Clostridiales bacterium]|jgi:endonuclease-3|nr:endonuclease III [Clostridiales bacterium]